MNKYYVAKKKPIRVSKPNESTYRLLNIIKGITIDLNETAMKIFNIVKERPNTMEQVREKIYLIYNIQDENKEDVKKDVLEVLNFLVANGYVEQESENEEAV